MKTIGMKTIGKDIITYEEILMNDTQIMDSILIRVNFVLGRLIFTGTEINTEVIMSLAEEMTRDYAFEDENIKRKVLEEIYNLCAFTDSVVEQLPNEVLDGKGGKEIKLC